MAELVAAFGPELLKSVVPLLQTAAGVITPFIPATMGATGITVTPLYRTFVRRLLEFLYFLREPFPHNKGLLAQIATIEAQKDDPEASKKLARRWCAALMCTADGRPRAEPLTVAIRAKKISTVLKSDHWLLQGIHARVMYFHEAVSREFRDKFVDSLITLNTAVLVHELCPDGMLEHMQRVALELVPPGTQLNMATMQTALQSFMSGNPDLVLTWTTKLTENLSSPTGTEAVQAILDMPALRPALQAVGMEGGAPPGLASTLTMFMGKLGAGISTISSDDLRTAAGEFNLEEAKTAILAAAGAAESPMEETAAGAGACAGAGAGLGAGLGLGLGLD
jgi:hypothetical protein